jgi:hypothetical protein
MGNRRWNGYSGDEVVATYQDQTNTWQSFNGDHVLDYAANGSNPYSTITAHVVYFQNNDGTTGCIEPGREAELTKTGPKAVNALMIRPGGKCYPGQ